MKPEKTNINLRRYLTVGLLSAAFCSTAARADLTAYYMLDNTTGTAATDSSGNGRNGTIGGAGVVWAPTSGMLGGAVKFDGAVSSSKTGRIEIPTTSLSTAAGTVALWARLAEPQNRGDGRNGLAYFFGFGSASGSRITMFMNNSDTKLDIEIGAATKADIVTLNTATWYHLAITWDGINYHVYVNGFEQATAAATISNLPTITMIGNKGLASPVTSMDGMVDEFRIYSTALSQSEIYSLTGAAGDPNPANGAGGVALNATLLWSAGIGATSHDVYFSTSNPPQFILNTTQTGYDPGPLSIGAVYYWKIDERNSIGTVTAGMVWSFSTPSAASNLNPANGAKKISVNTDLSWTAGSGAISETLYFGRTNPPALKGPVTANSYDPGTLDVAATYYWKIDTETSAGTLSSPLWSFRTEAPFYGDFNSDSVVDWMDIAMFVQQWLDNGGTADFDKSGNVDIADYAHLSNNWLASSIETGLVASLKMDEAAGLTAPDTSGNGNHGTLIGTLGAGIAWAPSGGTIDGAVNIDGSDKNARVEVPIPGMEIYSGAVSLWLRLKEPQISGGTRNGMRYIFGFKGVGETHKVQMFMSNDDTKLDVDIGKMSVTDIATLQTEKWYHLAVTWDGMIYWIYIDGQQIQSSFYGALHSVPAAASVGNDGQLNQKSFCGLIDNFRLYKRTISAKEVQTLAGLAICLSPADGSENISPQSGLNWSAGDGAGSSSVYLGTDRTSVEARDPATFKTSLQTGSFNPGTLALQTGYYWCIDENYDNAVSVKGPLWSFATISSKAADPYPADGANATENSPLLSWTAGYGATSRDVYFGTVTPPPFAANLPATNYQSPITNYNTTYYWRIDEHNSGGTVTGDIWSFTTAPLPPLASNPSPENASTGVSLTVNLGWTGTAATSFDVYFGSTGSPPFVGNQTGTSFDCNILNTSTVYYWRIDPVNAAGTTTGEVWSFTTTSSTGAAPPIADFFVMPPEGWDIYYIGEFISTSTGKITDYKWEFGDGTISTELTASHKYGVAGTYTVKLTVGGPGGVNSYTKTGCVLVRNFAAEYTYPDYVMTEPSMAQWDAALDAIAASQVKYTTPPPWCGNEDLDCNKVRRGGGGRVLFAFSDKTIYVDHGRKFYGDNLIIDGQDTHNLFYFSGATGCTQQEGMEPLVSFYGDDNIFRNVDYSRFPEGIHLQGGNRNVSENVNVDVVCEDAITINGMANACVNCVIRNCTYKFSGDKTIMVNDGSNLSRAVIVGCKSTNGLQPIRMTGTGLLVVRDTEFNGMFSLGARLGGSGNLVIFENNYSYDMINGVRLTDSTSVMMRKNLFRYCNDGIEQSGGTARYEENTIIDNNRTGANILTGTADFGGGSANIYAGGWVSGPGQANKPSVGGNILKGNLEWDMSGSVIAKYNFWDHNTVAEVLANDVTGGVTVDPLGTP